MRSGGGEIQAGLSGVRSFKPSDCAGGVAGRRRGQQILGSGDWTWRQCEDTFIFLPSLELPLFPEEAVAFGMTTQK